MQANNVNFAGKDAVRKHAQMLLIIWKLFYRNRESNKNYSFRTRLLTICKEIKEKSCKYYSTDLKTNSKHAQKFLIS